MKNALWGVVGLALLLAVVAQYRRQEALAERLDALERRAPPTAHAPVPAPAVEPERPIESAPAPAVATPLERTPAAARTPAVDVLTPAQREAIAKEVERQVEKRGPSIGAVHRFEEPMVVMERELGLSPAQKVRIEELFKRREEEQRKFFEEGFKGGPGAHAKAVQELEERYDTAIRQHLDFSQQQKYEELKKDGRLMSGVVFRVQLGSDK